MTALQLHTSPGQVLTSIFSNAFSALRSGILSDECIAPGQPNFTGAFVGVACQDLAGTGKLADFDFFEYQERNFCVNPALVFCFESPVG